MKKQELNYQGVIIKESLEDKSVLDNPPKSATGQASIKILNTKVEKVTERHATPYLEQWTLHAVEILEEKAEEAAKIISENLDSTHNDWYADFKNDTTDFIIFPHTFFPIKYLK